MKRVDTPSLLDVVKALSEKYTDPNNQRNGAPEMSERINNGYPVNGMFVVRYVAPSVDGESVDVIATVPPAEHGNQVAVVAKPDGSSVYGWEQIETAELRFTVHCRSAYFRPGDVVMVQTTNAVEILPREPVAQEPIGIPPTPIQRRTGPFRTGPSLFAADPTGGAE